MPNTRNQAALKGKNANSKTPIKQAAADINKSSKTTSTRKAGKQVKTPNKAKDCREFEQETAYECLLRKVHEKRQLENREMDSLNSAGNASQPMEVDATRPIQNSRQAVQVHATFEEDDMIMEMGLEELQRKRLCGQTILSFFLAYYYMEGIWYCAYH